MGLSRWVQVMEALGLGIGIEDVRFSMGLFDVRFCLRGCFVRDWTLFFF